MKLGNNTENCAYYKSIYERLICSRIKYKLKIGFGSLLCQDIIKCVGLNLLGWTVLLVTKTEQRNNAGIPHTKDFTWQLLDFVDAFNYLNYAINYYSGISSINN